MCSKKWAKPDLPGSTSLREPVCTGICSETMFGKPGRNDDDLQAVRQGRLGGLEGEDVACRGRSRRVLGRRGAGDRRRLLRGRACGYEGEEDGGWGAETRHEGISF